jgi:hypothetical protein
MFATQKEIDLYVRMTLRQFGLLDYQIIWNPKLNWAYGLADVFNKKIILSTKVLESFSRFRWVLLHEVAHCIQAQRNGGNFLGKNNRNDFHGKLFKKICAEIGISASRFISI